MNWMELDRQTQQSSFAQLVAARRGGHVTHKDGGIASELHQMYYTIMNDERRSIQKMENFLRFLGMEVHGEYGWRMKPGQAAIISIPRGAEVWIGGNDQIRNHPLVAAVENVCTFLDMSDILKQGSHAWSRQGNKPLRLASDNINGGQEQIIKALDEQSILYEEPAGHNFAPRECHITIGDQQSLQKLRYCLEQAESLRGLGITP
jgi:hypothetical protein